MGYGGHGRPTALVIDDDAQIARLLREIMSMHGYEVAEIDDGSMAASAIRALKPDVVLLDVGLPKVHGIAVLEEIKGDSQTAHIPVVIVTAWWSPELEARALATGAGAVVGKPFDISRIGSAVASARAGVPATIVNH